MPSLMRYLLPAAVLLLTGCGGASTGNLVGAVAYVVVTLDSTTSNLDHLRLAVVPLDGPADSPDAATDLQVPDWAQVTITPLQKRIAFTTDLDRVPYRVWVKNVTTSDKSTRMRITIEGNLQHEADLTVLGGDLVSPARVQSNWVEVLP